MWNPGIEKANKIYLYVGSGVVTLFYLHVTHARIWIWFNSLWDILESFRAGVISEDDRCMAWMDNSISQGRNRTKEWGPRKLVQRSRNEVWAWICVVKMNKKDIHNIEETEQAGCGCGLWRAAGLESRRLGKQECLYHHQGFRRKTWCKGKADGPLIGVSCWQMHFQGVEVWFWKSSSWDCRREALLDMHNWIFRQETKSSGTSGDTRFRTWWKEQWEPGRWDWECPLSFHNAANGCVKEERAALRGLGWEGLPRWTWERQGYKFKPVLPSSATYLFPTVLYQLCPCAFLHIRNEGDNSSKNVQ